MELKNQINQLFNNLNNNKLLCLINFKGQKNLTYKIYFQIIVYLKLKEKNIHPIELINQAIENTKPILEVRTRKKFNFSTQKPVYISEERRRGLAIRWIIIAAKNGKYNKFWLNLAEEFRKCYNFKSNAVKQKLDLHKHVVLQKRFLGPY